MDKDQEQHEVDQSVESDRAAERGDVAKPNVPAATEENEGMSTILSAEPVDGVQNDS